MLTVNHVGYHYRHERSWFIERNAGSGDCLLLLFHTPMRILQKSGFADAEPGACMIYTVGQKQHYFARWDYWINDFIHFGGEDTQTLLHSLGLPLDKVFYPSDRDALSQSIRAVEALFQQRGTLWEAEADLEIRRMLLDTARMELDGPELARKFPETLVQGLAAVRQEVFGRLAEDWTVERMAALASMSPSYFYRAYRSLYRSSPKHDLMLRRMEAARHYLCCSGVTVREIARLVGYETEFYFIRQFRSLTGVTPGRYAALHRGGDHVNR